MMACGKASLRQEYLSYREAQPADVREEKSNKIIDKLIKTEAFIKSGAVLTYLNFGSEVITEKLVSDLLRKGEKRIFCPRIAGERMDFYEITTMTQLEKGYRGIREPQIRPDQRFDEVVYRQYQWINIMPGAVFDRNCGRIGYGRGYYDRFLQEYPLIPTVALAYDCQLAPAIPMENHDIRPEQIITEAEIIRP